MESGEEIIPLQAREVLKGVWAYREKFTPVGEMAAWQAAAFPGESDRLILAWQLRYQTAIHTLRETVAQTHPIVTAENIETVQTALTAGYHRLLGDMFNEGVRLLGQPPCRFAWVGAGSFSRGEVLPYSDAEYLWLFKEKTLEVRWYFWALDKVIVAQLHSLDEPDGLHPDQYPEVSEAEETTELLPYDMDDIQHAFQVNCRTPEGVYTQIISSLQGKLIIGEAAFWDAHQKTLRENNLSSIFHKILFVSISDYEKVWEKDTNKDKRLEAKAGYGYFLTYLAVMLKFYHGVKGQSTPEIWQALINAGKIDAALGKQLAWASLEIQALRYRTHCFYQASCQDFCLPEAENPGEKIYRLSKTEAEVVANIQVLMLQVYSHLKAVKQLETLTKGDKSKNAAVTLFSADVMETFLPCIETYESLSPALMIPRMEMKGLQSLLKRLLDTPEYLLQLAGWRGFAFLLKHGAKSNIPNSVGITPLRMVLAWSEGYPDLAEKVWKQLLPAEGGLEERDIHNHATLLSQAMTENKHLSVIVLCRLGAGRTEPAEVLLHYIRTRLSAPEVPVAQKKDLQSVVTAAHTTKSLAGVVFGFRNRADRKPAYFARKKSQKPYNRRRRANPGRYLKSCHGSHFIY